MKHKGYLLILGTAFISGFSIFINKFGVSVSDPYLFAFLKNFLVAIFLSAILFIYWDWAKFKNLKICQWLNLMLIGLVGGSVPFLIFFKGLSMATASGASFIQKTMFIWVFVLAGVFLKEKITRRYVFIGLTVMAANIILLRLSDVKLDKGSLLVLMATFLWAVENTLSKYVIKEISPRIVMWSRMFFGSIFIFAYLFFTQQASGIAKINLEQTGWILITSVLLLGYVATWYNGLKYIKVSEAAIILMLGSPITTMLTAIFSRPATFREYLASGLIILGVLGILGADKFIKQAKGIYVWS